MIDKRDGMEFMLSDFYKGIDLQDKTVLDIGCGVGLFSIYARCNGAKSVVGLEPVAQGSTSGVLNKFRKSIALLQLHNIKVLPCTIQNYNTPKNFDVIVLYDSISHLDESACVYLHTGNSNAQKVYGKIFAKIYSMLRTRGEVVIADASSRNFYADLGSKNPFDRSIEWHKHQTPELWIRLLRQCGFVNPQVSWLTPKQLRVFDKVVNNKLVSYFLVSHFRLIMEKPRVG